MLDAMLVPAEEEDKHQALHQALRAAELLTQVRRPRATDTSHRLRSEVQGKPVSETIIEAKRSVGILCGQQRLGEEMT
jgi:hypothetical protein